MRYWKPEDICLARCPHCGAEIEFWKDEPVRQCPSCRKEVRNPKLDPGCAEWCKHGPECVEPPPKSNGPAVGEKSPPTGQGNP
jgi:DNA-directed RNA polymerase subunit RPC12/RpoP